MTMVASAFGKGVARAPTINLEPDLVPTKNVQDREIDEVPLLCYAQ